MPTEIILSNARKIAVVRDPQRKIDSAQEALELLMDCNYNLDTNRIVLAEQNLSPDFFHLKTGLAGDILQKFSTYNGYLAIIGDYSRFTSKSLHDFIRESNRFGRVHFVANEAEAVAALSR